MKHLSVFGSLSSLFLSVVLVLGLGPSRSVADSPVAVPVTVAPVKHEQRAEPIRNSGRISHKNEIRLSFKTSGLIESLAAEEGDDVVAGQVLATLDLEEINAQQQRAASNYRKAVADLDRFNQLFADALVSAQVRQNAQSATDSAAAELRITNFNKKLSVIRAPMDGRILRRHVETSELIEAGQTVFLLASHEQGSVVRVGLIDQDIVKVGVGDPASIYLDAYPGRKFRGEVSEVASSTGSAAGTFEVEIHIQDQGIALLSGLIARVEITPVAQDLQYYIPIEAIFKAEEGLGTVFVLDEVNQSVNEVSVEVVDFLKHEVIVRGSLKAGDRVIRQGAPYLTDGSAVSIVGGG